MAPEKDGNGKSLGTYFTTIYHNMEISEILVKAEIFDLKKNKRRLLILKSNKNSQLYLDRLLNRMFKTNIAAIVLSVQGKTKIMVPGRN